VSVAGWLGVAVLGGLGALLRFFTDGSVASRLRSDFPLGTMIVNISGAMLLGLLVGLALEGEELLLAGSATLGSYTTFSTWMLESQRLQEEGEPAAGAANTLISLAVGIGAVALGRALGRAIGAHR